MVLPLQGLGLVVVHWIHGHPALQVLRTATHTKGEKA